MINFGGTMNIIEMKELIDDMSKANIQYIKVSDGNEKVELSLEGKKCEPQQIAKSPLEKPEVQSSRMKIMDKKTEKYQNDILSKYIGFFSRINPKTNKPFVNLREVIKEGQVIAIVESIDICNEIKADKGGKIIEILVEEGQAVEYGQPVFRLQPTE